MFTLKTAVELPPFKPASQTKSAPLANPAADKSTGETLLILPCTKYCLSSSFILCHFLIQPLFWLTVWVYFLCSIAHCLLQVNYSQTLEEDKAIITEDHHCQHSSTCVTAFHGLVYIHQTEMGSFSVFSKALHQLVLSVNI